MTLTTIGYGDIALMTSSERVFACVAMLVGASIFAWVVGNIAGLMAELNAENAQFMTLMNDLNTFMDNEEVPADDREPLREFLMRSRYSRNRARANHDLLNAFSPALQGKLVAASNASWVKKVPMFENRDLHHSGQLPHYDEFIRAICLHLGSCTFSPREAIVRPGQKAKRMFIIQRGFVLHRTHILGPGQNVGADAIVLSTGYYTAPAVCLMYVDTFTLSRPALANVLEDFPAIAANMRRYCITLSFRSTVVKAVKQFAQQKEEEETKGSAGEEHNRAEEEAPPEKGSKEGGFLANLLVGNVQEEPPEASPSWWSSSPKSSFVDSEQLSSLKGSVQTLSGRLKSMDAKIDRGFREVAVALRALAAAQQQPQLLPPTPPAATGNANNRI